MPVKVRVEDDGKTVTVVDGDVLPGTYELAEPGTTIAAEYAEPAGDYEANTKAELVDELDARGLPTGGTKAELVARLQENDAQAGE